MSTLLQDLRFGLRMLRKNPVITAVAGLSLAIGIAVNAASFATVEAFLFVPLPYEDQESLAWVWYENLPREVDQAGAPVGAFLEMDRESSAFSELAAYRTGEANLTGRERPERLRTMTVTPDYFRTLGVPPARGRDFTAEDGMDGAPGVVVLHHDFWMSRLAGDPAVLGSTLVIDGAPRTVIGVTGERFDPLPANTDVFLPADLRGEDAAFDGRDLIVVGRLRAGTDVAGADRELDALQARLAAENPTELEGWTVRVQAARDLMPGPTDTRLVLILTAVTLFGLLIACANVANLLLGRAEARTREVAIRTAMGAERGRIVRQLLTESLVLALVAGAAGVVGAYWLLEGFRAAFPPEMPDVFIPVLRPLTLGAVLVVTLGSGILFGLAPALSVVRSDVRGALGEGSRGGTASRGRRRLRNAFVITEFAVALALLTGAAFLGRAFQQVIDVDGGFRSEGVLTFALTLPEDGYVDDAAVARFHNRAIAALEAAPGVDEAAVMSSLPRGRGVPMAPYEVDGQQAVTPADRARARREVVSPGWFEVLDVAVEEGRSLAESDRSDAPLVAVVDRAFVDEALGGGEAVGRTVTVDGAERRIVGVAETILHARIIDPSRGPTPVIYLPAAQAPRRSALYAVRGPVAPESLVGTVREAVWSVDPDLPVGDVRTLDSAISESLAGPRVLGLFLGFIGAVALVLAAMGIYGVLAHSVALQRRELGIRMALGADRGAVLGLIARDGLGLAGAGLLVGVPLAWGMYVAVGRALAGVSEVVDPVGAFGAIAASLVFVAVVACAAPAFRATRIDPAEALAE